VSRHVHLFRVVVVAIGWCLMTINVTVMCMWVAVRRGGMMVCHRVGVSLGRMVRMMSIVWFWMAIRWSRVRIV